MPIMLRITQQNKVSLISRHHGYKEQVKYPFYKSDSKTGNTGLNTQPKMQYIHQKR